LKGVLIYCWLILMSCLTPDLSVAANMDAAVAFYYGAQPPWDELKAFDVVVVDPDHVTEPGALGLQQTRLVAYVSLGEVQASRSYFSRIPANWLIGENKSWGSQLIDQSQLLWPQFFADNVIAPLWQRGYRSFFLDTLDAYQLIAKTPEDRARQEAGMVAVLQYVASNYPGIQLIFNRGFEILPRTHQFAQMVVAESLFQGFDASKKEYTAVQEGDRIWLTKQLQKVRETYQLPVVVIDYVPAAKRELARATAQRITQLGFTPWVTTPELSSLGVGSIEVMPRKVAVIHSILKDEYSLRQIDPVRFGAMPLNYLGYVPEYFDVQHLPDVSMRGRYAAVLLWLSTTPASQDQEVLVTWLGKQIAQGVPVAMLNTPFFLIESAVGKKLGFSSAWSPISKQPVIVTSQDRMLGYERPVSPPASDFFKLEIKPGEPLLTFTRGLDSQAGAALTPWGGYVLPSHDLVTLAGLASVRWVIDPFSFFKQAMRLPDMPVPDVTTESGRRMLMVHMDGDGFISRSALPGAPIAGVIVRDQVVNKYKIPMTLSVIEAEISVNGLYPSMSAHAQSVARDIFRAPHVEIASHSFSHPFSWRKASADDVNEGYNLRLPGYKFDLRREIEGSIRYIEQQLAPPGKKVQLYFWTGDCIPGSDALALTKEIQLLNFNGGDTVATRSQPTLTQVEGLGLPRKGGFQVFAPNQNENVYTNNWTGPFYGFERVTETFEFTEAPRRLKPMDIYFHAYITTKPAGTNSLHKVFSYALSQETTPVHVKDYARKVLDFQSMVVARTASGWRVRGGEHLRTLRWPSDMGYPNLANSRNVAGFTKHQGQVYAHLGSDIADLSLEPEETKAVHLVSANGQIESFQRIGDVYQWRLSAYVPLKFTLANAQRCQIRVDGRVLVPVSQQGTQSFFEIPHHVAKPLEAICRT